MYSVAVAIVMHWVLFFLQSFEHAEGYKPRVISVKLDPNVPEYSVVSKCTVDFELEFENKGLEGMVYINNANGMTWLVCTSNQDLPI